MKFAIILIISLLALGYGVMQFIKKNGAFEFGVWMFLTALTIGLFIGTIQIKRWVDG